jgi:hypothetical protein
MGYSLFPIPDLREHLMLLRKTIAVLRKVRYANSSDAPCPMPDAPCPRVPHVTKKSYMSTDLSKLK